MIEDRLERLRAWAAGTPAPPETFEIGLTADCNQSCGFCWRQNPDRPAGRETLTAERLTSLIREAAGMGVRYLRVIGEGEPLFRPDAPRILESAAATGMRCFLCTNGTLLTRDLVDRLVEWGWDWLNVSLEGPDAAIHDALTSRPGSFGRIREALVQLAARKRQLGKPAPSVNAGVTLVRENFRSLPRMPAVARELGLFGIYLEPVTVNSPESARMKLSQEEAQEWMEDVRERFREEARAHGIWTNADEVDAERVLLTNRVHADRAARHSDPASFAATLCFHPFWFLSIRANGDVGSCGTFTEFNTVNLREGSLAEVWHGPWFQRFRERMRRGDPLPHCASCNTGFVQDTLDLRRAFCGRSRCGSGASRAESLAAHVL